MRHLFIIGLFIVVANLTHSVTSAEVEDAPPTAGDIAFFESRIRPVLIKHCYECHSTASADAKGGLLLDSRDSLQKGGESGAVVVPEHPAESLLLESLRYESLEMPPAGKLSDTVIADFEEWIRRGTPDPRDKLPTAAEVAAAAWEVQFEERRGWWSLQPLRQVSPPQVGNQHWSHEPIDQFILARLRQANLQPSAPAHAEVLLRRLSFALTGLPPKPELVVKFPTRYTVDPEKALTELVDALLESPHFGERFARHWMDAVRYTDTYGYEWDNPARGSWEYRDYLIRAFNDDIGFDQLIREQLAGDLLHEPRINEQAGVNESLIGPMFYHLGEHRHGSSLDFNGLHQDMIDNKIDAFSKVFLATTVACARCHDHKLDAISQKDYYALAGIFMSPRWTSRVIDAPHKNDSAIAALTELRDEIHRMLVTLWSSADSRPLVTSAALRQWAVDHADELKTTNLNQVVFPIARLAASTNQSIASDWITLKNQWQSARIERLTTNNQNYTVLSDFSQPGFPDSWTTEGDGITHGYVREGTPLVSLSGNSLIDELLPQGYHTHALSSKLPGAVRLPPQQNVDRKHVSLRLRGGEWAGRLTMPQNAFQSESVKFFDSGLNSEWDTITDKVLKNGVNRIMTEFMTASLNPNFPPRTGLASAGETKLDTSDDGFDKRSWLSITGIVVHDRPGAPTDPLDHFQSLYESPRQLATTCDEAWDQIADWLNKSVVRWTSNKLSPGDTRLINWLIEQDFLPNRPADAHAVSALVEDYRNIEATIDFPRTANSMDERNVAAMDYRLNVRGNPDEDGPEVARGFLSVFNGTHRVNDSQHSGRQELAEYLSSHHNPQTARVYVNRVWQWIFGQGIVATPDDFGRLGDQPSHPELLDWLATEFMDNRWSTKRLVRRLVLSQTFRQSGHHPQHAVDQDPDNRLLHHYPTRRLEAEAVRDSMLMVSGTLDSKLYGRPINPPRLVEDGSKRLYSGPIDSNGRRSLYMEMSIMDPPKFLVAFNLPELKLPAGRRDVTNVPAQALALLNDPLVIQLAKAWGQRVVQDGHKNPSQRVQVMFISAVGRRPDPAEIDRWTNAVLSFSVAEDPMTDERAWSNLAHAFFNAKEFLYYR
ncbi:MAG: PSD1 and planctomycete cytochrome C domain-containing protein [Fuerstiella sp.]|nr:PSD1 and planctomycete cytochrome C domain-containing protein [Fuerstiella sp.]